MKSSTSRKLPDTLVIIFGLVLLVYLLSFVTPIGKFSTEKISYDLNGVTKSKTVVIAESFEFKKDIGGNPVYSPPRLFASEGKPGFVNFVYDGLTSGDRDGGAVAVIAFILIIGGAFGIILRTGVVEAGILRLIGRMKNSRILILPLLTLLFSLGGAIFGMGEEAIPFVMILAPIMVSLGYNAVTAVIACYVATQVGFATSWMNPFSIAVAQGVAHLPILSGAGLRLCMWSVFTLTLMFYVVAYARKVEKKQTAHHGCAAAFVSLTPGDKFGVASWLIIATLIGGTIWVIYGVTISGYYIPEIASQFLVMGVIIGIIAIVGKVNRMTLNEMVRAFKAGAADMIAVALIVGMARGIILMMGGSNPEEYTMLNTLLHSAASAAANFSPYASAGFMLVFQSIFNVFVPSGSAQAALTMPLMAPLADLVGVSRQVSVLAFQLGDGLTNIIIPTSAVLMGALGAAKVEYTEWLKCIGGFFMFMMLLGLGFIILAVSINYV